MSRLYTGDVQGRHGETPLRHTSAGRAHTSMLALSTSPVSARNDYN